MRVMIRASYVVTLSLVNGGGVADAPPAPPAPPRSAIIVSDTEVVGCYEVVALRWETPPPKLRDLLLFEPSQAFFLSAEFHPLGRRMITPRGPDHAHTYSGWRVVKQTTIEAVWSAGPDGVRASMHRHPKDPALWEGLAERVSRNDPSQGWIVLRRTSRAPCRPVA